MSHEERITRLEQARRELEESLIVMTHLETRQSNIIRNLAERQAADEANWQKQKEFNAETDRRIAALVSAIGESFAGPDQRSEGLFQP